MKSVGLSFRFLGQVVILGLFLWGCGPSGNKPNVELIQDMMDQPAVKPLEYDAFFPNGQSALEPPEHTRPKNVRFYAYSQDMNRGLEKEKNPFEGQFQTELLLKGQKSFNIHCAVCHGVKGLGDGPLKAAYPLPIPSLVSEKVRSWPDARIFHVMSAGQGVMGGYGGEIPYMDRWAVVQYIRHLQKTTGE